MPLLRMHDWDTNHFGFKVARLSEGDPEAIGEAMDTCLKERVRLVISRISTDNIRFAQELERLGFQIMDTVTRYRLNLSNATVPMTRIVTIRPCLVSEAELLASMARSIYVNHMGHFHNDPKINRSKCNEVYAAMIRNSCIQQGYADLVLVAETEGQIVGFHSHRVEEEDGLAGIVSGVIPKAQGKGVGRDLILASIDWAKAQGLKWIEEYPHINNYRMHNLMTNLQFRMQSSSYTFHKWFEKEA